MWRKCGKDYSIIIMAFGFKPNTFLRIIGVTWVLWRYNSLTAWWSFMIVKEMFATICYTLGI